MGAGDVEAAVAHHDGGAVRAAAAQGVGHHAALLRAGPVLPLCAADAVEVSGQTEVLHDAQGEFLRLGGGDDQLQPGSLQALQQLRHALVGDVLRPALPGEVHPEVLHGPIRLLLRQAEQLREAFVEGRTDEGGEGIGVSDDALLPQGVGHGAGDALLGVRHRAVQIEKYRIPAHQSTNSFTQRR